MYFFSFFHGVNTSSLINFDVVDVVFALYFYFETTIIDPKIK